MFLRLVLFYLCDCASVCCMLWYLRSPEQGIGCPRAGATGGCRPLTQMLESELRFSISRKASWCLSHLSRPLLQLFQIYLLHFMCMSVLPAGIYVCIYVHPVCGWSLWRSETCHVWELPCECWELRSSAKATSTPNCWTTSPYAMHNNFSASLIQMAIWTRECGFFFSFQLKASTFPASSN